jgi:hypothetical protein
MKHKTSKRSTKQSQTRRSPTSTDHIQTISPNKIDLGTGTVDLDSHTICLKPNVPLKSQKILKRDLLRCSNQRPSLLGVQTLQPPRITHHGSQPMHSVSSSSLIDHRNIPNHRSLSVNSRTIYSKIDRIAPWPDISINRLCSDENDLLRPIKNYRHLKNPGLFSPKYYAALNDNTKFKFYPSKRTYIEEYRKQKGYLLNPKSKYTTSLSLSSSTQFLNSDDDQLSTVGTYSAGGNGIVRERSDLSITNPSLARGPTKSVDDIHTYRSPINASVPNHLNILPSIPIRNNNLRSTRHTQLHHQTITLPTLANSSIQYLNNMTSFEKSYGDNKKNLRGNQSKLFVIDGRQNKRYSISFSSTVKRYFIK